jgi:hypothetical protein
LRARPWTPIILPTNQISHGYAVKSPQSKPRTRRLVLVVTHYAPCVEGASSPHSMPKSRLRDKSTFILFVVVVVMTETRSVRPELNPSRELHTTNSTDNPSVHAEILFQSKLNKAS